MYWETLRTFTAGRFVVRLQWQPETDPDLSWDETGEVAAKLDSGEYVNACFRVVVTLNGAEIGADYLGNSIYADLVDFATEHVGLAAKSRRDGCNYGVYFPDMIRTAIHEAREWCATAEVRGVRAA